MADKRTTRIGGADVALIGEEIRVGQAAPEFSATANDWSRVQPLAGSKGLVRVLAAVPSLETSVCDRETRRFNVEAANPSSDVRILAISTDLPFTQKRWCAAAGVDGVTTLSDHMQTDFGLKYGCLIKERRILRRAVFVVDRDGRVVYAAYMPALGEEPKYDEVLATVRQAL
ncbi:MAG: thiol peroxidase [Chloroflexota bacterium]